MAPTELQEQGAADGIVGAVIGAVTGGIAPPEPSRSIDASGDGPSQAIPDLLLPWTPDSPSSPCYVAVRVHFSQPTAAERITSMP